MATATERQKVIDDWLEYASERMTAGAPGDPQLVLAVRVNHDAIVVRTLTAGARFVLVSCHDDAVDDSAPIYPATEGITHMGDGTWR